MLKHNGGTNMDLSGNTILITGGSSGIGFEFARQLSKPVERMLTHS